LAAARPGYAAGMSAALWMGVAVAILGGLFAVFIAMRDEG
jgi:hypothetical protein